MKSLRRNWAIVTTMVPSHIEKALEAAGWAVERRALDDVGFATAQMIVTWGDGDLRGRAWDGERDGPLTAMIVGHDDVPVSPVDLVISPTPDMARLAAEFRQWRLPDVDGLVRMEQLFGRESLMPIVEGLRDELQAALNTLRAGGEPEAHRLAGLSGTLGFMAASASWKAVDLGTGDVAAARRDSRTALLAIRYWMRAPD